MLRDHASIHHVTASGGGGGAIDAQDAIVTLRDAASIHDATATGSWGGAISGLGDLPVITIRDDASLYRNHAVGGTAIASGGTITIAGRATIHDNDGTSADAPEIGRTGSAVEVWAYGAALTTLTIQGAARIRDNVAATGGGGLFIWTACGDHEPTVTGARGRVIGNTPKNVVRWTVTDGC